MAPSNKERVLKVTVFHYRKPEVSEEDFHRWLNKTHVHDAVPIHKKYEVLKWTMTHTPAKTRDMIAPAIAPRGPGWKVSDHDGYVTYWIRRLEDLVAEINDPYWHETIIPEDEKWADTSRGYVTAGWEEVYIENGEIVNMEDGNSVFPIVEV